MLQFIIDLSDPFFSNGLIKMIEPLQYNSKVMITIEMDKQIIKIGLNQAIIHAIQPIFKYCTFYIQKDSNYLQIGYEYLQNILKYLMKTMKFADKINELITYLINFLMLFCANPKIFSEIYFYQ